MLNVASLNQRLSYLTQEINNLTPLPPSSTSEVIDTDTSATYYPVFVDGAGSGQVLRADTTTTPISVNPSTGDFLVVDTLNIDTGNRTLSVGKNAGSSGQANFATAIGEGAGQTDQGTQGVSVGVQAGNGRQGGSAIAIGNRAGFDRQGANSLAIGQHAGQVLQSANTIVLNATGIALNGDLGVSRLFIDPIRPVALGIGVGLLSYDPVTKEVVYSTS